MSIFDFFKKQTDSDDAGEESTDLSSLQKNSIVMEVDDSVAEILPHASKIGGKPLLPANFAWPVYTDKEDGMTRPLSFLCQINLADVKPYDTDNLLPDTGILSFFYECVSLRWGFDPSDAGGARVFYFADTTDFVPTECPIDLEEGYRVPEMAVCFASRPSYPRYEEFLQLISADWNWDAFYAYDDSLQELGVDLDSDVEEHKLLGYADLIQGAMLSECERTRRGLYCGDAQSYQNTPDEVKAEVKACATDWTLLLQLTTLQKDDWEWMWGDCGMLYFYIRKQDLADKNFDQTWFVLQCS